MGVVVAGRGEDEMRESFFVRLFVAWKKFDVDIEQLKLIVVYLTRTPNYNMRPQGTAI